MERETTATKINASTPTKAAVIISSSLGTDVPKTRPFKYLKAEVAELTENGTYLLGELLEPKPFTKIVLKKGKLVSKTFTIEGNVSTPTAPTIQYLYIF